MQDVQQGKAPQVRWLAVAEQFRAGDGDVAFHYQQFTAAMRGGFKAEADLAVDFRQARVAALVGDAEVDIRVALAKPAQVGGQPAGGPGRRGDNAQALAQVGHAHGLQGAFDMVEGIAQVRGEGEAGFGQGQALGCADEEGDAEVVFQLFDLAADGALGDVEAHGGLAEAAVAGDFFEDAEHVEGGQLAHEMDSTPVVFMVSVLTLSQASSSHILTAAPIKCGSWLACDKAS
ncbi:hypothetical protein AK972_2523 [Pseudomonas yamanorum]|nr:hypothetical protein AK972_2523 [Pseudomonas yamanorum]